LTYQISQFATKMGIQTYQNSNWWVKNLYSIEMRQKSKV